MFGYAGGGNVISKNVDDELAKLNFNLSTHTIVGDVNGDSSPVVLGMVGSDRFINVSLNAPDDLSRDYTITRHGNSMIELRASEILCPWDNRSPPNGCIQ